MEILFTTMYKNKYLFSYSKNSNSKLYLPTKKKLLLNSWCVFHGISNENKLFFLVRKFLFPFSYLKISNPKLHLPTRKKCLLNFWCVFHVIPNEINFSFWCDYLLVGYCISVLVVTNVLMSGVPLLVLQFIHYRNFTYT